MTVSNEVVPVCGWHVLHVLAFHTPGIPLDKCKKLNSFNMVLEAKSHV